ncbi:MAG: fructose-6-phosphate aldolase [Alphaproteobacteria bacterium]|jgi:transaldolase|nr:fructose-6-phosphate aldolase [Alphaproteobacteria bacterium]
MKFFVDGADVQEIKALSEIGMVDGITTNPSIIAKTGKNFFKVIEELCALTQGPVSAEVTALDAKTMIQEALKLRTIASNVCIKVPLTEEGLKACYELRQKDIMVNVTLCFSALQAIMAAKAGATYVSPFIGRLDDIGHNGLHLIEEICQIYDQYPEFSTEVLAASVRSPFQIREIALMGADVVTAPSSIIRSMVKHPLTDKGIVDFLKDWEKTGQSIL